MYGTADMAGEVSAAGPGALAEAAQLSDAIRSDVLAFAATGDPGWPRFHTGKGLTRVYRREPVLAQCPQERSRALWRRCRFGVLDLAAGSGTEG